MVGLEVINHIGGYIGNLIIFRQARVIPDIGFLGEDVDDTGELIFTANRQRHDQWVCTQNFFDLLYDAVEVCTDTIELVDENQSRDLRVIRVAPVGF